MSKICFMGCYGIKSQGDDAALLVMLESLKLKLDSFESVVITRHADEEPYRQYGLRSIQNIEYSSRDESAGRWFYGFNYNDNRDHLRKIEEEIAGSDLVIMGAGNLMVDISIDLLKGHIPYFFILSTIAKMHKVPIMWFGTTVGPFKTNYGRNLCRLTAEMADVVTVRDIQSKVLLEQMGINKEVLCYPDPVLGLNQSEGKKNTYISYPYFAVSVRDLPEDGPLTNKDYASIMAEICDVLIGKYKAKALFIPQCTYEKGSFYQDDRNTARLLVDKMQNSDQAFIVNDELSVYKCLNLYKDALFSICTRLHANVYSAIQGVPPLAINYHPKVSNFMNWLNQNDYVVDPSGLSVQRVIEKVDSILKDREAISVRILQQINRGRKEIDAYADIAIELLKSKSN